MAVRPTPTEVSRVEILPELAPLADKLAESRHELWVLEQIGNGWRHGKKYDDSRKLDPSLVPYHELAELDRERVKEETLHWIRATLALGYRILPPELEAPSADDVPIRQAVERLSSSSDLGTSELVSVWRAVTDANWRDSPDVYERLSSQFLRKGSPLLAHDVAATGLSHWPKHVRLRQLQALGLARSGASLAANERIAALVESGQRDGETYGLLGRTYRDIAEQAAEPESRQRYLALAYEAYAKGFRVARRTVDIDAAIYTGINTATSAFLRGDVRKARSVAQDVREICLRKNSQGADYWAAATLGEVALLLGDLSQARILYAEAARIAGSNYADLVTTRRQARRLLAAIGEPAELLDACFRIPRVVAFAGHLIDRPDQATPRFPQALARDVRRAIRERLADLDAGFGFSSAACGSDILFAEEMQKRGGECHLVLGLPADSFERDSVDLVPGTDWKRRYRSLLKSATHVVVANEFQRKGGPFVYEYASRILSGLAMLKASTLETELTPLVVWDGEKTDKPGGTSSFVKLWQAQGHEPEIIDVKRILKQHSQRAPSRKSKPRAAVSSAGQPAENVQHIKALLFADVVGYSKLTEEEIPLFLNSFMSNIADWIAQSPYTIESANSWGDALYFVFPTVAEASGCALALLEKIRSTDWAGSGMGRALNVRIGLHAGPVYEIVDPITKQRAFTGTHVSRAARIEPITPPGEVYASEPFAALAAAEGVTDFVLDYVGITPLAKSYGHSPLYHVRRVGTGGKGDGQACPGG